MIYRTMSNSFFFFIILKEFREVALGLFFFKDEKKNQSFIVVCFHGLF